MQILHEREAACCFRYTLAIIKITIVAAEYCWQLFASVDTDVMSSIVLIGSLSIRIPKRWIKMGHYKSSQLIWHRGHFENIKIWLILKWKFVYFNKIEAIFRFLAHFKDILIIIFSSTTRMIHEERTAQLHPRTN